MEERKATIKAVDMTEELQQDAIDCATTVSVESVFFLVVENIGDAERRRRRWPSSFRSSFLPLSCSLWRFVLVECDVSGMRRE